MATKVWVEVLNTGSISCQRYMDSRGDLQLVPRTVLKESPAKGDVVIREVTVVTND